MSRIKSILKLALDRLLKLPYLYWPGFLYAMILSGLAFIFTGSETVFAAVFTVVMASSFVYFVILGNDLGYIEDHGVEKQE